jgi:DNA-directed RNA polymerase subunit E'|tara:strand:- start:473 stop:1036 length:564 start_codon:yes stop_codon:yes gene_type:complete
MFYEVEVKSHIRVSPELFNSDTDEAIIQQLNKQFEGFISKDFGFVVAVSSVVNVGDGIIIPGDGAAYYETSFKLFTYKPELQEVVLGRVLEITDFGAFINIGAVDGMVHVSQAMDDYVTFSKSNVLTGRETKKSLKVGDKCRARVIALSYKDPANPKIGLTMRQHMLGNLKWIDEELKKQGKESKKK